MFAQKMLEGLASGGWVIGFLASVGGFFIIIGILIYLLYWAGQDPEEDEIQPTATDDESVFDIETLPKSKEDTNHDDNC